MLLDQHTLRDQQPEVVPEREPVTQTTDNLGNQTRAERAGLAGATGSEPGDDTVGVWPAGGPEPLVDLGPADVPTWPTVDLAAAAAIAWIAESGEDGACVLAARGGFAVHALDDGAWIGGFDASWLGDAKDVFATDPKVQAFVTGDGRVLPVVRGGRTEGLEAADVDAIDTVAGSSGVDEAGLEALFVERVRARVLENLKENERFVLDVVLPRYEGDGGGTARLREVLEEFDALAVLRDEQVDVLAGLGEQMRFLQAGPDQKGTAESADALEQLRTEWRECNAALTALLAAQGLLLQDHPEAIGFLDRQGLPDFELLDDGGTGTVLAQAERVLEAIDLARSGVLSGDIDVLDIDGVVTPTLQELSDERFAAVGRRVVEEHVASKRRWDLVIAGLQLGALAVAIFCSGGLAAAVIAGAAVLGAGQAVVNLEDALDKRVLAATHLDPL